MKTTWSLQKWRKWFFNYLITIRKLNSQLLYWMQYILRSNVLNFNFSYCFFFLRIAWSNDDTFLEFRVMYCIFFTHLTPKPPPTKRVDDVLNIVPLPLLMKSVFFFFSNFLLVFGQFYNFYNSFMPSENHP